VPLPSNVPLTSKWPAFTVAVPVIVFVVPFNRKAPEPFLITSPAETISPSPVVAAAPSQPSQSARRNVTVPEPAVMSPLV